MELRLLGFTIGLLTYPDHSLPRIVSAVGGCENQEKATGRLALTLLDADTQ